MSTRRKEGMNGGFKPTGKEWRIQINYFYFMRVS
jgi:hypothetical protein